MPKSFAEQLARVREMIDDEPLTDDQRAALEAVLDSHYAQQQELADILKLMDGCQLSFGYLKVVPLHKCFSVCRERLRKLIQRKDGA